MTVFDQTDIERVIAAVNEHPPLQGDHAIDDYVLNVALTSSRLPDADLNGGADASTLRGQSHSDHQIPRRFVSLFGVQNPDFGAGNTEAALVLFCRPESVL